MSLPVDFMASSGLNLLLMKLKESEAKVHAGLMAIGTATALRAEAYMKINRRWKDRTGNARRMLYGRCLKSETGMAVRIGHGASYGINLELNHEGKYEILKTTSAAFAPQLYEDIKKVLQGAFLK